MRKAVLANAILMVILILESAAQVATVKADPFPLTYPPIMNIFSPISYTWEIYQTTSIPVDVRLSPGSTNAKFVNAYFRLDIGPNTRLKLVENSSGCYGQGTLNNLANGYHFIKVYSTDTQGKVISSLIKFLVNATFRFPTFLLSPTNTTYRSKEIPLTYTIDSAKYTVLYLLDNSGHNLPLDGNTTLSELAEGQHTITARATNQTTGIYSKQTVNFTINTGNEQIADESPTPSPAVPEFSSWTLPVLLSVMAATAGLLVYHKKHKRKDLLCP